jgi:hypothetical protein
MTVWWEQVAQHVYDMYLQYKRDRMRKDTSWMPKPSNPEKYKDLSREYFRDTIYNKDERYSDNADTYAQNE